MFVLVIILPMTVRRTNPLSLTLVLVCILQIVLLVSRKVEVKPQSSMYISFILIYNQYFSHSFLPTFFFFGIQLSVRHAQMTFRIPQTAFCGVAMGALISQQHSNQILFSHDRVPPWRSCARRIRLSTRCLRRFGRCKTRSRNGLQQTQQSSSLFPAIINFRGNLRLELKDSNKIKIFLNRE